MSASPSVFAISGYSGAGTKTGKEPKVSPASLRDGVRPYSLTDHIHEREAGYHLSKLLGADAALPADDFKVAFMPHVAPWFQGIIATVSVPLKHEMRASEVRKLFDERYGQEKLVQVQNEAPEIYQIAGKHGVRIGGIQVHSSGKRVVLVVSFFSPRTCCRFEAHTDSVCSRPCRVSSTTSSRAPRRSASRT